MTDVDRQIARSSAALERVRERYGDVAPRARRRREAEVLRRLGRIALADGAILAGALLAAWFAPLGTGGALLVALLLVLATAILAVFPAASPPRAEALGTAPLQALPAATGRWLDAQRPALPAPARTLADAIGARLDTLGPQLAAIGESQPAAAEVRKLVGEQLPELIRGYERVPAALRGVPHNGRTPDQQLVDGLAVIEGEMADLSAGLARGDLDAFATRGRYLQVKYGDDRQD